jgi:hypothetical protein
MNEENSFEEKPLANLNDLILFIILLPQTSYNYNLSPTWSFKFSICPNVHYYSFSRLSTPKRIYFDLFNLQHFAKGTIIQGPNSTENNGEIWRSIKDEIENIQDRGPRWKRCSTQWIILKLGKGEVELILIIKIQLRTFFAKLKD